MKKRKKRRSKTEGGDKLPFDAEMGKNQKAIKVLQRLFDAGYGQCWNNQCIFGNSQGSF